MRTTMSDRDDHRRRRNRQLRVTRRRWSWAWCEWVPGMQWMVSEWAYDALYPTAFTPSCRHYRRFNVRSRNEKWEEVTA